MADKRRSSPGTTMSLKAHAFSVEALIGAEKQQQQQQPPPPRLPKRRKLGGEDEAAEDEGGSGCCAKSSPAAAAGRTCGDMDLGCAARAPAGECRPAPRRSPGPAPRLGSGSPFPAATAALIPRYPLCLSTLRGHPPPFPLAWR
ncbi:hypothetical protein DV515_00000863 [Chloebia gouldiae]|uniref:Uncharacterized protein n=1 Tax=Chloebia gouldiae TaxID=44316 RepID=A0A3L8T0M8_CHLGU|nr:hypothetical protein DV515_00000863 [Chloebia gouldiae]